MLRDDKKELEQKAIAREIAIQGMINQGGGAYDLLRNQTDMAQLDRDDTYEGSDGTIYYFPPILNSNSTPAVN